MSNPLTTLNDELASISSLVELMKQEQRHLVGADVDGLSDLTPQKSQLIQDMAALATRRHAALGGLGMAPSEAGMQAWLATARPDAAALWQQVLDLTTEAKELNRVNGMLISKQMAHTQMILQAMRTPTAAADNSVYGPNGQTTGLANNRRFVLG
jgi:flagella synthesis protein FlgN